ncbi:hypothetical protein COO60DRAFT_425257 [Scenedesmus sp. NREL 46B-D3]|nr:hypothetical protein COO60DRAFT_425257 [Scenedesmus sp. NREL 46B-D3]
MRPSLLHLPAAQQLSADAVVRILTAAVEALPPHHTGVASVCALPGALLVGAEVSLKLLQRAAQRSYQVWLAVLHGLPQLADLPAEQVQRTSHLYRFMAAAMSAGDSEGLHALCCFAADSETVRTASHLISPEEVQFLVTLASNNLSSGFEPLLQLGAAKALGPDAVAALMAACLEDGNTAVWCWWGSCQQQRSSTSKQQRRWCSVH